MKCETHDIDMDWIDVPDDPYIAPDGGFWSCPRCVAEEEGSYIHDDETDTDWWNEP